ncbi:MULTISPECIES: class F sortase [Streptomyces]|uniref:class F sortase n=1 Tax=Streptomyces TaxID=1883 RepID=UPI0031D5B93B
MWRRDVLVGAVVALALCGGSWLVQRGVREVGPPPQPSREQAFSTAGMPLMGPRPDERVVPPLPAAAPTRVRIPAVQVDAPLVPLGLEADGTLASPPEDDRNLAGWYAGGTAPGAAGTAVVAGHVDTGSGPAVFYSLGALKKGDTVEIAREDARTAVFTIDAIEVYDKADFPSERVYGATNRAELRLITCGGGFSQEAGAYLGNVVVYAHLTGVLHLPQLLG